MDRLIGTNRRIAVLSSGGGGGSPAPTLPASPTPVMHFDPKIPANTQGATSGIFNAWANIGSNANFTLGSTGNHYLIMKNAPTNTGGKLAYFGKDQHAQTLTTSTSGASVFQSNFDLFWVGAADFRNTHNFEDLGDPITFFSVSSTTSTNPLIWIYTGNGSNKFTIQVRSDNATTVTTESSRESDGMLHVFRLRGDVTGKDYKLYIDGVLEATVASASFNGLTTLNRVTLTALQRSTTTAYGSCSYYGDIILYNSLQDANAADIKTYLDYYYITGDDDLNLIDIPSGFRGCPAPFRANSDYTSRYEWNLELTGTFSLFCYVDPVNGNDAGAGTEVDPFKTIKQAINSTAAHIYLTPGVYDKTNFAIPNQTTRPKIMECVGGVAYVSNCETCAWTKTGGQTNVYQHTMVGSANFVRDTLNLDANSVPTKLNLVASIAAVDAAQNSYFITGGVIYIHTFDSSVPSDNRIVINNTRSVITPPCTNGLNGFKNVMFLGHSVGYSVNTQSQASLHMDGGGFVDTGSDHLLHYKHVLLSNGTFSNESASGDVLDYRYGGLMLEDNLIIYGAGADDADNASTQHDGHTGVSINSTYTGGKRTVHDITAAPTGQRGDTQRWMLNCTIEDATSNATVSTGYNICASVTTSYLTEFWLDNCTSTNGQRGDLYIFDANGIIRTKNMDTSGWTTVLNGGTLTTY